MVDFIQNRLWLWEFKSKTSNDAVVNVARLCLIISVAFRAQRLSLETRNYENRI